MTITSIDSFKLSLIKKEVSRAAQQMQNNRPNRTFTGLEKALGYAAFQNWLAAYLEMDKRNDPNKYEFYQGCNHSGRLVAISLMEKLYRHPKYLKLISSKVENINPIRELELASVVTYNDQYWENCTTRATIMICRQLAYNYTGVLGEVDFRLAGEGISWQELAIAVDQWLDEELTTPTKPKGILSRIFKR